MSEHWTEGDAEGAFTDKGEEDDEGYKDDDITSSMPYLDFRTVWMRDKVLKFLGLAGHDYLFDNLMSENDHHHEDMLLDYFILSLFGVTDLKKKLVSFYKTYHIEAHQEEISVWEESGRDKSGVLAALTAKGKIRRLTKSAPGKVEKREEVKKLRRRKKAKERMANVDSTVMSVRSEMSSETMHSTRESAASASATEDEGEEVTGEAETDGAEMGGSGDFSPAHPKTRELSKSAPTDSATWVPPPGQEDKYIVTKKMVERIRKTAVLHLIFGEIDASRSDLQDLTIVYFLRTSDEGVPPFETYEECHRDITKYLLVGSLNGKNLLSMNRLLVHVFKPLIDAQFRGPNFVEAWKKEKEAPKKRKSAAVDEIAATFASVVESRSTNLRRPSEFRRVSITLAKKDEMSAIGEVDETKTPADESGLSLSKTVSKMPDEVSRTKSSPTSIEIPMDQPLHQQDLQCKKDILGYLEKLISSVEWTIENIEGDILLNIPKIPELFNPQISDEMLEKDKKVIEQLEEVAMSWGTHMQRILDMYTEKKPESNGPVAEYEYWQDREYGLSLLIEQLRKPIVKRVLALLDKVLSPVTSSFDYQYKELRKFFNEAKDNKTFLQTVLRHFKLLTESDSFRAIADIIPSLTEGLKMIWILSDYYSNEDKMMGLLQKISWQLSENVKSNLAIDLIFKGPVEGILKRTEEAHRLLKKWKESYLKTREEIEISGKGVRWEFDQRRLFVRTEYIAKVCSDLNKVASVLEDFYNIFGPELKSIITDPAQIDAILARVDKLILLIQEADFNHFDESNRENWDVIMESFDEEVSLLETEANYFIDECFRALINAEQSLRVLLKFKSTKTRHSIQEQLTKKFDGIMQQFSAEISAVEGIFNRGKRNPPLLTYHPPTAGAIFWVRQLLHRLRKAVLYFQNAQQLKHNELKLLAFNQYLDVAKNLKSYEESKFDAWVDKAQFTVNNTMKQHILKVVRVEPEKDAITFFDDAKHPPSLHSTRTSKKSKAKEAGSKHSAESGSYATLDQKLQGRSDQKMSTLSQKDQRLSAVSGVHYRQTIHSPKVNWVEFLSDTIIIECHLRFEVNFDWTIFNIIQEAELLEQLNFELPESIKDIGIQKDRLRADIEATQKMIDFYNTILEKMGKADIQLTKSLLHDVERNILPGVVRFNWHSLSITDYAKSCKTELHKLNSIVGQLEQLKIEIEKRIETDLQSYNLFSIDPDLIKNGHLLPCKTYFDEIEKRRREFVATMFKTYESMSPMLIKVESLVLGTATGRSPAMQLFYEKYEKGIFVAFVTCVSRNLELFNNALLGNKPIFQVDAVLLASEVVLRPSPNEIYSTILHSVKYLLDVMKKFPRWLNGTCIQSKPQKKEEGDEIIVISFFEDVICIQAINDLINTLQDTAQKVAIDCHRYLVRWRKFNELWSFDKIATCEKFASGKPTLTQYDERFTFYGNILEQVQEMEAYSDVDSVRINLGPLLSGIEQHAKEWKQVLGNYLVGSTIERMKDLASKIDEFRTEVELVVSGLDRFTLIMQAISNIKKNAIQAEVSYNTFQETFKTLRFHGIEFPEEYEEMGKRLEKEWESVYLGALYRASTLESTYDTFAEMTEEEIKKFVGEVEEFARDFDENGPGSIEEEFELGLKKMAEYGKLIAALEEKRLNHVNSEILFDLPPTDYSTFLRVKEEFDGMEMIYALYRRQKSARDEWAQTLWVNLNPQQLMDGMDQFIREFRKFPKNVRGLQLGQTLEASMKNFKNSIPLFIELKNEAMRDRHWKELMKKTGQYFEIDPDRCETD